MAEARRLLALSVVLLSYLALVSAVKLHFHLTDGFRWVDSQGSDSSLSTIKNSSKYSCEEACKTTYGCVRFNFRPASQKCDLKSASKTAIEEEDEGSTSGKLVEKFTHFENKLWVDSSGHDSSLTEVHGTSTRQNCETLCLESGVWSQEGQDCVGFTYIRNQQICKLKSEHDAKTLAPQVQGSHIVSGKRITSRRLEDRLLLYAAIIGSAILVSASLCTALCCCYCRKTREDQAESVPMREVWTLPGRPDDTYDAMTVTPTYPAAAINTTSLPNTESGHQPPKATTKPVPVPKKTQEFRREEQRIQGRIQKRRERKEDIYEEDIESSHPVAIYEEDTDTDDAIIYEGV